MRGPFGMVPRKLLQDREVPHAAKTLYAYLATYADPERKAFPSVETMRADLSMCRSSVIGHLNILKARGYVEARRRGPTSSMYTLLEVQESGPHTKKEEVQESGPQAKEVQKLRPLSNHEEVQVSGKEVQVSRKEVQEPGPKHTRQNIPARTYHGARAEKFNSPQQPADDPERSEEHDRLTWACRLIENHLCNGRRPPAEALERAVRDLAEVLRCEMDVDPVYEFLDTWDAGGTDKKPDFSEALRRRFPDAFRDARVNREAVCHG